MLHKLIAGLEIDAVERRLKFGAGDGTAKAQAFGPIACPAPGWLAAARVIIIGAQVA